MQFQTIFSSTLRTTTINRDKRETTITEDRGRIVESFGQRTTIVRGRQWECWMLDEHWGCCCFVGAQFRLVNPITRTKRLASLREATANRYNERIVATISRAASPPSFRPRSYRCGSKPPFCRRSCQLLAGVSASSEEQQQLRRNETVAVVVVVVMVVVVFVGGLLSTRRDAVALATAKHAGKFSRHANVIGCSKPTI